MKMKELITDKLTTFIYDDRANMGRAAAKSVAIAIENILTKKAEVNIIFAAAPSQNEMLEALLEENIDFSKINAFHMDEYVGLGLEHPQSFASYLIKHIFERKIFKSVNLIPATKKTDEACKIYTELIEKNPPDIVCLGVGENGHIAFNDPPVADFSDNKMIKVVKLEESCRMQQVHDKCFAALEDVPKYALTLTIPALMSAEYLICTVPGPTKSEAIRNMLCREIGEHCPATILRKHEKAALFLDRDSAKYII